MSDQFRSNEEFIAWNEEMSRIYNSEDYHFRSSVFIRFVEQQRVKAILDLLDVGSQDTVLEVGCGAGVVLEQIPAGRLVGVDLSGYILRERTRKRLAKRPSYLIQGNAETLPFASASFRKILCTEVIEHVRQPRNVAKMLATVATDDADIIITIPNEELIDGLKALVNRIGLTSLMLAGKEQEESAYDSPEETNEWHLHAFDLPLLQEVVTGVLTIEQVVPIPAPVLPLRYVVKCKKVSDLV